MSFKDLFFELLAGNPRIRIYMDIRISGFPDFRISGYPDFRISGNPGIRASGFYLILPYLTRCNLILRYFILFHFVIYLILRYFT